MCFSENGDCWKQPWTKLREIGVLKSLKKVYGGNGILPEEVIEMLQKNFAKLKKLVDNILS